MVNDTDTYLKHLHDNYVLFSCVGVCVHNIYNIYL